MKPQIVFLRIKILPYSDQHFVSDAAGFLTEDVFLSGWQMDGETIIALTAQTPVACLSFCQQYPACAYAVLERRKQLCHLKKTSTATYRTIDSILVASSIKMFTRQAGVYVHGDTSDTGLIEGHLDGTFHPVGSEEVCRKLCAIHPKCNVANFWDAGHPEGRNRNRCTLRQVYKVSHVNSENQAHTVTFVAD